MSRQNPFSILFVCAILCASGCGLLFFLNAFADDVGNSPPFAAPLTTGTFFGVIDRLHDRDVFLLTAEPYVSNLLTFATGTVWDLDVDLLGADGVSVRLYTNTASISPFSLAIVSTTVARRIYLSVNSLAEFSTGTYQIVYQRTFEDADADSLPDGWEIACFGSLTTANSAGDADLDGMPDRQEWLAGTHPADASSRLELMSLERSGSWVRLFWKSAPEGTYRISRAERLGESWVPFGHEVVATSAVSRQEIDLSSSSRVWRVELLY